MESQILRPKYVAIAVKNERGGFSKAGCFSRIRKRNKNP